MDMVDRPVEAHEESLLRPPITALAAGIDCMTRTSSARAGASAPSRAADARPAIVRRRDIMIVLPLLGLAVMHAAIGA